MYLYIPGMLQYTNECHVLLRTLCLSLSCISRSSNNTWNTSRVLKRELNEVSLFPPHEEFLQNRNVKLHLIKWVIFSFLLVFPIAEGVFPDCLTAQLCEHGKSHIFSQEVPSIHTHTHTSETGNSARLWPTNSFINLANTQEQSITRELGRWSAVFQR